MIPRHVSCWVGRIFSVIKFQWVARGFIANITKGKDVFLKVNVQEMIPRHVSCWVGRIFSVIKFQWVARGFIANITKGKDVFLKVNAN